MSRAALALAASLSWLARGFVQGSDAETRSPAWLLCVDTDHARSLFALLSAAAYCNPAMVETWTCLPCLNYTALSPAPAKVVPLYDPATDTQGYVLLFRNGGMNVAFRGSVSLLNWITDMKAQPVKPYPPWFNKTRDPYVGVPSVHPGFIEAFLSIRDQMYQAILSLCPGVCTKQCTVQFTGHSLGAALAALAQADYALSIQDKCGPTGYPMKPLGAWTFGEPRVGDEIFAKLYWHMNLVHCRFTHRGDVVPHLPPMLLNYTHEGLQEEFYYNNSGESDQVTECSCSPEGPRWDFGCEPPQCSNGVPEASLNVEDHLSYMGYPISNMCGIEVVI